MQCQSSPLQSATVPDASATVEDFNSPKPEINAQEADAVASLQVDDEEAQDNQRSIPKNEDEVNHGYTSESDTDGLPTHHRTRADVWERRKGLDRRKRNGSKQRWQHNRYVMLLDDRLGFLEQEVGRLTAKSAKDDSGSESDTGTTMEPSIPEIKSMSWDEYVVAKGKDVPSKHYAIDILVEEPVLYQERPEAQFVRRRKVKKAQPATTADKASSVPSVPNLEAMPERIRINSPDLCKALAEIADRGMLSYSDGRAIVMRRPFKFLSFHEERIKALLAKELGDSELNAEEDPLSAGDKHKGWLADATKDLEDNGGLVQGCEQVKESAEDGVEGKAPEPTLASYLKLLLDFLSNYVKPTRARVSSQDRIIFQELQLLFQPGQVVYMARDEYPQKMWRVFQVTGGHRFHRHYNPEDSDDADFKEFKRDAFSPLALDCYFLAFDGTRFRRVNERFLIPHFPGDQPTRNLDILPYDVAKRLGIFDEASIFAQCQQYDECTRPCHRHYTGRTIDKDSVGRVLTTLTEAGTPRRLFKEYLDAKVMVDFEKAFQQQQSWMPDFDDLPDYKTNGREWELPEDPKVERIQRDFQIDARLKEEYLELEDEEKNKQQLWSQGKIGPEDQILLPDRVPAFVLRSRRWVYLKLGHEGEGDQRRPLLDNVPPNFAAWNDLELPGADKQGGHKNIIQSLVDKHFAKDMTLDLVRDKGRGLIILLHGAPGVGKTSTAECVAEAKGNPLLPITCGDLGLDPQQVETNLSKHFELAQRWDCILLLDEADVFLAQRNLTDLKRNALVSVFLRILEYYEGILFLTTNKVGLIDEAFKSRIHMALHYPWLDQNQTEKIWMTFIRRAKESQRNLQVDEWQIINFARVHMEKLTKSEYGRGPDGNAPGWNGRQIKNAFMSALALAQFEGKGLGPENEQMHAAIRLTPYHFDTVARASEDFDRYLYKVHKFRSDAQRADGAFRYDSMPPSFDMRMPDQPVQSTQSTYQPTTPLKQQMDAQRARHEAQHQAPAPVYNMMPSTFQSQMPMDGSYHSQGQQYPQQHMQQYPNTQVPQQSVQQWATSPPHSGPVPPQQMQDFVSQPSQQGAPQMFNSGVLPNQPQTLMRHTLEQTQQSPQPPSDQHATNATPQWPGPDNYGH